jgi:hypothetical protein
MPDTIREEHSGMFPAEIRVRDFIRSLGLEPEYERPIFLKDTEGRPRVWTPDFYLKELGMYVEVWGKDREVGAYKKNYDYRKEVYKANRIPMVYADEYKDEEKWQSAIIAQIDYIHKYRNRILKRIEDNFNSRKKTNGKSKRE